MNLPPINELKLTEQEQLIDITDQFFNSVKLITNNRVVKAAPFELLEGTRALEVLNPRLDTGIINLSKDEIGFDCCEPQSINSIISIEIKLIKCLINWLEKDSLPVTILSCRYVSGILDNYLLDPTSTSFHNDRSCKKRNRSRAIPHSLVHKVLKSSVDGLCKFVGFVVNISNSLLYEEEDLITRNMNYNFLSDISISSILSEIDDTIEWILGNEGELEGKAGDLITLLNLVKYLNMIESDILTTDINFLAIHQSTKFEFCKNALNEIEKFKSIPYIEQDIPLGSFSKFIQRDSSNRNIPAELSDISLSTTYSHLANIFQLIYQFTNQADQISSINQLHDYLNYNVKFPISKWSVFARGLFQLFFIRDDKTIFGTSKFNLTNLSIEIVENLMGKNTIVLHNLTSSISQVKEEEKNEIYNLYNQNLKDLESGVYHYLLSYGSNQCRSQQLISKSLLLWDTLQVSWESFELQMMNKYQCGDLLKTGQISLTITSYLYYSKMNQMLDLLLNGFELEIYKLYEYYLIYWYGEYLILNILNHLNERITNVLIGKINYIEVTMPNKIKKLKSGPKKNQLKQVQLYNQETVLPQLMKTLNFNQNYLIKSFEALKLLISCNVSYLIILSKLNLLQFNQPKQSLTSLEHLFYLRMKPYSSIGVPEFPSFQQYENLLKITETQLNFQGLMKCIELLTKLKSDLSQSVKNYEALLNYVEHDNENFIKDSLITQWYSQLKSTAQSLQSNVEFVSRIIQLNKNDLGEIQNKYKINVINGEHKYFPNITIVENDVEC